MIQCILKQMQQKHISNKIPKYARLKASRQNSVYPSSSSTSLLICRPLIITSLSEFPKKVVYCACHKLFSLAAIFHNLHQNNQKVLEVIVDPKQFPHNIIEGKRNHQQTSPTETKDCISRKLNMWTRTSCGSWVEPETTGIGDKKVNEDWKRGLTD